MPWKQDYTISDERGTADAEIRWPRGARCCLSIVVDLSLASGPDGIRATDLTTPVARFAIEEGLPNLLGVLRRHGLRELWSPESECFEYVLTHLRGRDLTGKRIVVQEHGQSLSMAAHALRRQGASVLTVPIMVTPMARAHWQATRPTPPAAAWYRMVSPPLSG